MFGTNVEFSELVDPVDLLPVEPNPRGGFTSSSKISNEYRPISGIRYLIHYHESNFAGIRERIMCEVLVLVLRPEDLISVFSI